MPKPENLITADDADGAQDGPATDAEAAMAAVMLSPAQVEALDRDGDGQAGGSKPRKPGAVVRRGQPIQADSGDSANVLVRITKAGRGEVHDGQNGRYEWGDEVVLPRRVAEQLEQRAFAEIVGDA